MIAYALAALLSQAAPLRLELRPERDWSEELIERDEAERLAPNPYLAAPGVVLLGIPVAINVIVGELWLLGGGAVGQWSYVGYGALSLLPVLGPWVLYLIGGPTPFAFVWSYLVPRHELRRGVLIDAVAQTAGAALLGAALLLPEPRRRALGLRWTPRGVAWVF